MAPGTARAAVRPRDVGQAPLDLHSVVVLPVRAERRHLAAGQRLRDAVGAAGVGSVRVPARLTVPEVHEAGELPRPPASLRDELGSVGLGRAGRRRVVGGDRGRRRASRPAPRPRSGRGWGGWAGAGPAGVVRGGGPRPAAGPPAPPLPPATGATGRGATGAATTLKLSRLAETST